MKKRISYLILMIIILSGIIVGCVGKETITIDNKKIIVGTSGTYYPFTFASGSDIEGFDIDVWKEIGKRLNYDIEFKTASFSGLFGMLDTGKVNTISNQITVTDERREKYLFADPYVYSGAQIIVDKNNSKSINNFEDLKGKKVGVDLGSNYEKLIKDMDVNNEIEIITYQNTDAAFNELLIGRIDAVIIDKISAVTTINEKGLELSLGGDPIEKIENAFPFIKNAENEALVTEINNALREMKSDGTFTEISNKWLNIDVTGSTNNSYLKELIITVLEGLKVTLGLSVISMIIALVIGVFMAVVRFYKVIGIKQLVEVFISFFRGTPLLVQLFLLYFGLPQLIPSLKGMSAFTAAILGLALNASSYIAESLRGAMEALDKGQMEACISVGMTKIQALRRVLMPQVFRIALPSLGNIFVDNIKGSSLAFTLGVTEILAKAQMSAAASYKFFESYIVVAIVYWITIGFFNRLQKILERKISIY